MPNQCVRRLYLLLAFILCFGEPTLADSNSEAYAASVLFDRFETVMRAESTLLVGSGAYGQIRATDARELRSPFYLLLGGLNFLGTNTATALAETSGSVLVGASDFRPPKGLGPVRSKRCYIFVLSADRALQSNKYFRLKATASAEGWPVWSWSAKLGEFGEEDSRTSSLYATQIAQSYLIVSNDLQELRSVSNALNVSGKPLGPLHALPDWDHVSTHDIWAYRRYRFTSAPGVDRSTQEVWNRASGMGDVLAGAEALAFWVDSGANRAVLRLIDPSKEARTAATINARGGLPPLTPAGQGVWEATISLLGDEESSERLFGVMYMFGFGAYV